jgi:hypothetical protein
MTARPQSNKPDLDFEHIEMLANFSDYAFDYPKLSFEEIVKKLGVDFSKAKNGKAWEKECMSGLSESGINPMEKK